MKPRRMAVAAVAVGLVLVAWIVVRMSMLATMVDGCAGQLAEAAKAKDAGRIAGMIENPKVRAKLLGSTAAEVGFSRPLSREWSRVGLFVTGTATSAKAAHAEAVVLLLETAPLPECRFLLDYEKGAFSGTD